MLSQSSQADFALYGVMDGALSNPRRSKVLSQVYRVQIKPSQAYLNLELDLACLAWLESLA